MKDPGPVVRVVLLHVPGPAFTPPGLVTRTRVLVAYVGAQHFQHRCASGRIGVRGHDRRERQQALAHRITHLDAVMITPGGWPGRMVIEVDTCSVKPLASIAVAVTT